MAAEKIELVLKSCQLVSQIWIYGDSFKNCLIAVVVPNEAVIKSRKLKVPNPTQDEGNESFKATLLSELKTIGKTAKLQTFELPMGIILAPEFTIEANLLTPTMKLKRPQLKHHFNSQIDALYSSLENISSPPPSPAASSSS